MGKVQFLTKIFIIICIFSAYGPVSASDTSWENEQWGIAPFTDVLGGGPSTGPAEQAIGSIYSLCASDDGYIYAAGGQFIDVITPEKMRYHLAGNGEVGFNDGFASRAKFAMGIGSYSGGYNIVCGPSGDIFVADNGNKRVRRIFRDKNGAWQVGTWAGGGDTKLEYGESCPAKDLKMRRVSAIAVDKKGITTIASSSGYYRVSADGSTAFLVARWPPSLSTRPGKPPKLNVMMGDADEMGNVYFVSRTPDFVVKIDAEGKAVHVAGVSYYKKRKPYHLGDGHPKDVFFDSPSSLVAEQDGSAVYVCGGDEYDIRRVPVNGGTYTATLIQNGRWYRASVHPNRSRGPAVFTPEKLGKLKPDGKLRLLMISHMAGRNKDGEIYGLLKDWVGMTQIISGQGMLGTKIFRLSRRL
ncbi:hypothetical protein [Desulfospira joergensenii]|uniref:hypothetical protein n=1 Tax=Desulfospira joergensenii TaxID=53329 RepID=UPI0003B3C4F2|nr:hypothetical protein [Desulfospira joergensenii]